jgi:hypothetical protein
MENKNQIPIIALAVFIIVILLANGNIEMVFALEFADHTMALDCNNSELEYVSSLNSYVCVSTTLADQEKLVVTNSLTNATSTLTLPQPTSAGSYTAGFDCSGNTCSIIYDRTVGSDRILKFSMSPFQLSGNLTLDSTGDLTGGTDQNSILVFSGTWFWAQCDSGDGVLLGFTSSSETTIEDVRLGDCAGTKISTGVNSIIGVGNKIALTNTKGTVNSNFEVWNIAGGRSCIGNSVAYNVVTTSGRLAFNDDTSQYLISRSNTNIDVFSTTCVDVGDITSAQLNMASDTNIREITVSDTRGEIHVTSNARTSVMDSNPITTRLYEFTVGDVGTSSAHRVVYNNEFEQIGYLNGATNNLHIAYLVPVSSFPQEEPSQADNDCLTNPETVFCRLGGSNDNSTSGLGSLVGNGIVNLGCNVAFVDCTEDDNPATNGLGLLIFIASIFVVIGMFYWGIGHDAFRMPLFLWVVIILALSAFFTITGIIDPIFLILSIIALIALAAPKAIETLRGSTFGRGSSE